MRPVKIELSSHKGPMINRLVEHVQLLTTWLTPFRVVPDDYDYNDDNNDGDSNDYDYRRHHQSRS